MHLSKILQKIGQLFALRWQDTDVVVGENSLPAGFVLFTIQKTNLDLPPPPPPHYLLPSPRDHKLRESWWNRKHEAVTGWSNPSQGERIVTDRPAASHAFSVKSSLLFFFSLSPSQQPIICFLTRRSGSQKFKRGAHFQHMMRAKVKLESKDYLGTSDKTGLH